MDYNPASSRCRKIFTFLESCETTYMQGGGGGEENIFALQKNYFTGLDGVITAVITDETHHC